VTLAGKVVVVTGSTRGIGRAIAEECARQGASVVVSSRTQHAVSAAVEDFTSAGWKAAGIPCDVSRIADLELLLAFANDTFGHVDVWFNNAGISPGYVPLDELSAEELHHVVDVNLLGTLDACRMLIPYFTRRAGVLVNVSGRGGRGDATPYTAVYGATKAAVLQLTKSLARENRRHPNLSIHALLPGMVDTDFYGPEMRVSPHLTESARNIPLVLKAIGVPKADVGLVAASIAAQKPGAETGKVYSAAKGSRMMLGGFKLMGWRMSGRMTKEP
jgi:NAD(P)-dependent dehydrogenase (short-subunit alcohol dehydrogenase family)